MNLFNGKGHFWWSCSSETLGPVFTIDCVSEMNPRANFEINIGAKGARA